MSVLCGVSFSAPAQDALRLLSHEWPPFTGPTAGQDIAEQLVETALTRAGIEVVREHRDWAEVLPGIAAGEVDGSPALWKNDERQKSLLFSEPYLENRLVLVGCAGSDVSATSFRELNGKRVAVVEGYAYGETVQDAGEVEFVSGRDEQQNLRRLMSGEVDYMLVDDLLVKTALAYQAEDMNRNLAVGSRALVTRNLHLALRRDVPEATELLESFNREIRAMRQDGSYNRILGLEWIQTDVDGDGTLEFVAPEDVVSLPPVNVYALNSFPDESMPLEVSEKIWFRGKLYDGWEDVPEAYKEIPDEEAHMDDPRARGVLFRFAF